MRLTLKRIYKGKDYTIGRMFVEDNGQMVYFCDSLEPPDRGLKKTMSEAAIRKVKLAGKTAIPRGTYAITLKIQSPKFRTRYWRSSATATSRPYSASPGSRACSYMWGTRWPTRTPVCFVAVTVWWARCWTPPPPSRSCTASSRRPTTGARTSPSR